LVAAGFNLFSAHFILQLCGSFAGFAEGLSAKERLDKVGLVVGPKVVVSLSYCQCAKMADGRLDLMLNGGEGRLRREL
jgi:hypothetical protein